MNKGELKKRIKEQYDFTEAHKRCTCCYPLAISQMRRDMSMVEKWIDEARKELEEWRNRPPKYLGESTAPDEYTDLEKFYYARDEWLEEGLTIIDKWFGDEE